LGGAIRGGGASGAARASTTDQQGGTGGRGEIRVTYLI
jgi:hypothetical protein